MFRQLFFLTLLACAFAIQLPREVHDSNSGARSCEYCSGTTTCAEGLECQDNTCERLKEGSPRCELSERCGRGQYRKCRVFRTKDRDESGQLKRERIESGYFVGRTFLMRRCVGGLKRFRCERSDGVCRHKFCITFTLKECEELGLAGKDVVNETNQIGPCCVFALPTDCYAVQLCRCMLSH